MINNPSTILEGLKFSLARLLLTQTGGQKAKQTTQKTLPRCLLTNHSNSPHELSSRLMVHALRRISLASGLICFAYIPHALCFRAGCIDAFARKEGVRALCNTQHTANSRLNRLIPKRCSRASFAVAIAACELLSSPQHSRVSAAP